jgi:hypothetical protein
MSEIAMLIAINEQVFHKANKLVYGSFFVVFASKTPNDLGYFSDITDHGNTGNVQGANNERECLFVTSDPGHLRSAP